MWGKLLKNASAELPPFNDYLLIGFRKQKIEEIKDYLNTVFGEMPMLFENGQIVRYIGYESLSPIEHVAYIKNRKIAKNSIEIQRSSFEVVKFNFDFNNKVYPVYVYIPYMRNQMIWNSGNKYYLLLPEVERGGLCCSRDSIKLKVMRAILSFYRDEMYTFTAKSGKELKEVVPTAHIHQKKQSRAGRKLGRMPVILYDLVMYSFDQVVSLYGFGPDVMQVVVSDQNDSSDYEYFPIKGQICLRVNKKSLENIFVRRFVVSYLRLCSACQDFILSINDLLDNGDHTFYKITMGKYIFPEKTEMSRGQLLYDNAKKHLETTITILDPKTKHHLRSIGIKSADIFEFVKDVFFNIDQWVVGYDPIDLYNKKIASLEHLLTPLVNRVNRILFSILNNRTEKLDDNKMKDFVSKASQGKNWLSQNTRIFRVNPSVYNDNMFLSVLGKRFRSYDDLDSSSKGGKKKSSKKKIPKFQLKAHPSQLVVESVNAVPSASPVVSGEINPYLEIDSDGNIIRPTWFEEIAHVFD